MAMRKWEPFPELVSLRQAMDRLFEDSFVHPSRVFAAFGEPTMPAVDAYQTPNEVVVKAALPGIKPEDVDIDITGDILTIKGEIKAGKEVKQQAYFYQEHRYGSFSRSLTLPGGLEVDKVDATVENGILTITIPKSEKVKPKVIKVKAKETKGKK
jgi:HSP20 family protein